MGTWTHERKETHRTTVTQIGKNMFRFTERFRQLRPDKKACQFCRKSFIDGALFSLAFTDKGNKLMCSKCTDEAIENGVPFHDRTPAEGHPHDR